MKCRTALTFALMVFFTYFALYSDAAVQAKWTVMVFMNGDNNLEEFADMDFEEIAEVGSTADVNVIVQMDRINGRYAPGHPTWGQTLRFRVTKGMEMLPENAYKDLGEVNMGSGSSLEDFVTDSKMKFPAQHYALIIWDHGQGWRAFLENRANRADGMKDDDYLLFRSANETPVKSVSHDQTNDDELFNREIQDSLKKVLNGSKIDIIGFDACLMSMVETAYAMRDVASVMVGSEELEPGYGWNYTDWIEQLVANPSLTAKDVGKVLVNSYEKSYGPGEAITLSALDLNHIKALAETFSVLADELQSKLNDNLNKIKTARADCFEYAARSGNGNSTFHHIDLARFLDLLAEKQINQTITADARNVRSQLNQLVIANFATEGRKQKWGSFGLAIYFPKSKSDYDTDPFALKGYEQDNMHFPVEFVQNYHWDEFLHAYFRMVP